MSQCCGKIPTMADVGFMVQTICAWTTRFGNIALGAAGEEIANTYAVNEMGLELVKFDKQVHGFDNLFRNGDGKLVIGETKTTKASGISSLGDTNHGKEGSVEWVEYKARLMCDPLSSFYSEANRKIGEEILSRGAENVEFVLIHVDVEHESVDVRNLR